MAPRGPARFAAAALAGAAIAIGGGCTAPRPMSDSYEQGRGRVVELVNDTGSVLPSHQVLGDETRDGKVVALGFRRVTLDDTDRGLCYKKVVGFAYAKTGDRQPEVRTIVDFPPATDTTTLLNPIAKHWSKLGYSVDIRGLKERFPKLKATAGAYTLYATALTETAGFGSSPKLTLYAVGRCAKA